MVAKSQDVYDSCVSANSSISSGDMYGHVLRPACVDLRLK